MKSTKYQKHEIAATRNIKLREWVETTRERPGRGNWGERNSKLREWVETV